MFLFIPARPLLAERRSCISTNLTPNSRSRRHFVACAASVPPLIVGLNQYSHDASIAVIDADTGDLLFAQAKERLSRRKHDGGDVTHLVPYALSVVAAEHESTLSNVAAAVKLVVANNHHYRIQPFEARLPFQASLTYVPSQYLSPWNLIGANVPFIKHPVAPHATKIELSHHLAHAFSAIYNTPSNRGLIVIMDGMGESLDDMLQGVTNLQSPPTYYSELSAPPHICSDHPSFRQFPKDILSRPGVSFREAETAYIFERDPDNWSAVRFQRVYKRWTPENAPSELINHSFEEMDSVGAVYSRVSSIIFKNWNVCGKVMGLAPYGAVIESSSGNDFVKETFIRGELFDGSLDVQTERYRGQDHVNKDFSDAGDDPKLRAYFEQTAHEVQADLQRVVVNFVESLVAQTGERDVMFAGGVALNSCVNGLLANSSAVRTLHVPAYPGDEGIAIGCAYFGHVLQNATGNQVASKENRLPRQALMPFHGRGYTKEEVNAALVRYEPWVVAEECDGVEEAARGLVGGDIVAWFNGRSECGPRALGNRSLLADARRPKARSVINDIVKRRESFRPLAPAVLSEDADIFFKGTNQPSCRFMSMTRRVKLADDITSVVHIDGTARVQVVSSEDNSDFHRLISCFKTHTGTGVILNTSLNIAGQPIVESPDDALRTLLTADGIDMLAFRHVVVRKRNTDDLHSGDIIRSACESFRSIQEENHVGESIRTILTYVPSLAVHSRPECTDHDEHNPEETIELYDGLQLELLEHVHNNECTFEEIISTFEADDESDNGPTEADLKDRIEDLIRRLLVYKTSKEKE